MFGRQKQFALAPDAKTRALANDSAAIAKADSQGARQRWVKTYSLGVTAMDSHTEQTLLCASRLLAKNSPRKAGTCSEFWTNRLRALMKTSC